MHTNDGGREQQIIQAMCDYATQLTQPDPTLNVVSWIVANVPDITLHAELHEAIELSLALGPVAPVTELTPHEHERSQQAAARMRQRWRRRVAALQRGDH